MKVYAMLLLLCVAVQAQKPSPKPQCKDGDKDEFHNAFWQPFMCVDGRWTYDAEAMRNRQEQEAIDRQKYEDAKVRRVYLWNALRTRVISDAEMREVLEIGSLIVPEKDGGGSLACGGACAEYEARTAEMKERAELILQSALLNQFKMRTFAGEAKQ